MFALHCLLILLSFAVTSIKSDCLLSRADVENDERLYIATKGNSPELLISEKVPRNAWLHIICNEQTVETVHCQPNGQFNPPLNPTRKTCTKTLKTTINQLTDPACPAALYVVGFVWQNKHFELYRSCYNKDTMQLHFETHATSKTDFALPRPIATFTSDRIITAAKVASFKTDHIYKQFKILLGPGQNYIKSETDTVVDRGHLAPSADYFFNIHKRATFKYINVGPQYSTLNRGNWHIIENWVRANVDYNTRICTGTIGVSQIPHSTTNTNTFMFLMANNVNPVPEWWFKIVKINNSRFVFLAYNNIYEPRPITLLTNCQQVSCPASIAGKLNSNFGSGQVYCCNPNTFRTDLNRFC